MTQNDVPLAPVGMAIAFAAKIMCFSRKRRKHDFKEKCPVRIVKSILSF